MLYEIEIFPNQTVSIKDLEVGEAMHSRIGPWEEAMSLYIQGSGITEAMMTCSDKPLIIYDMGLGIAANSLATVETFLNLSSHREIQVFSFENNLEGLRFALSHSSHFPFLEKYKNFLELLLQRKTLKIQNPHALLSWHLLEGDFRENLENIPSPDFIYYDLFSPKKCPHLWEIQIFETIFRKIKHDTLFITYSAATAIRNALMLAGFYVGLGAKTNEKTSTTHASKNFFLLKQPLDESWLNKIEHSSKPLPQDWHQSKNDAFKIIEKKIKKI